MTAVDAFVDGKIVVIGFNKHRTQASTLRGALQGDPAPLPT